MFAYPDTPRQRAIDAGNRYQRLHDEYAAILKQPSIVLTVARLEEISQLQAEVDEAEREYNAAMKAERHAH